mgnify:FL=1
MEENKISKGKEILAILLLTMVIATGTFAWIVWSSKDNTKMNITIGDLADVSFKTGNDINISNLSPSFYYDDGALTEFSIRKKKGLTTELNTSIYLDITSISDELKNDNFKYVLLSSTDGNTYNEVISSSFKDASVGKLDIVTDTPFTDGKTYYKFYIWIDGNNENNETMQGKSLKGTLNVYVSTPPVNAVNLVEGLDKGETGDSGSGVYKVTHSAIPASSSATGSEIPAVTDYRYYGPSPNNYICLDMEGGSTCPDKHLYRIIGSIYEEKENTNRIKVIKATPLTDGTTKGFSWDYTSSGSYSNIWATITSGNYSNSLTSGSQLMKLLNSGLWWNGTSGSYYNNSKTATNVNFTNYKLSDKAKSYITTSRYYLGGYNNSSGVMTNQFYTYERRTIRHDTNRPLYWDGMVGLMYPSDYGYAAGNTCVTETDPYNYYEGCKNKDWLWMTTSSNYSNNGEWLMSPSSGVSDSVFRVDSTGFVLNIYDGGSYDVFSARPVFYLSSSASISDGEGTSTDPYIVS